MDRNRRVIKKEYIPQSNAYKIYYEGGGVGYGSDSGNNEFMGEYVADQKSQMEQMIEQQKSVMSDTSDMTTDEISRQRADFEDLTPDDSEEELSERKKKLMKKLGQHGL